MVAAIAASFATVAVAAGAGRTDLTARDLARVLAVTAPTADFSRAEVFEAMQGGAATSTARANANAFSLPSANLPFEGQERFVIGNGFFRKDWVSSPSSTQASDGLGPLYNARSCQGCHIKDGRGHAPANEGDPALSLLVRLSRPDPDGGTAPVADPVYGWQLQDQAVAGLPPEGRPRITYDEVAVPLAGGEAASLRRPTLRLDNPGYGAFAPDLMISWRIAPPMIGLGLLEAIAAEDILARADPDDSDGDGISGRVAAVLDIVTGATAPGRFGWKAAEASIRGQSAHAFAGDMGLSTSPAPNPYGDCTAAQAACLTMPNGVQPRLGAEEAPDAVLDAVVFYASNLAVPARRGVDDPEVLAGKAAFYAAGCPACHTPKFVTSRDAAQPELRFQLVWPYTDLLLHDMGAGLADHRPEGDADGFEWRTPPLWGIGLSQTVHAEAGFLHDGRARTLLEAVLWHGGEAAAAREQVVTMTPETRASMIAFLESL